MKAQEVKIFLAPILTASLARQVEIKSGQERTQRPKAPVILNAPRQVVSARQYFGSRCESHTSAPNSRRSKSIEFRQKHNCM